MLLRATDVSYAQRVRGVTLALPRGGIAGLIGPNGSGKTTLVRLLAGALKATGGRVWLSDRDLHEYSRAEVAKRIAVVPQETHLAFDYTVLEIALMGRYPHLGAFELEGPTDLAIAHDSLARTGTAELASRAFATLSGGEKQRVIIASALAQSTDIMLLDEPTASLDLAYQIEIAELLRRLNRDHGLTILVATHDLNFAADLCSHLFLLREGRLLAAGPTTEVLTPDAIRTLYGVHAVVERHHAANRLTVVAMGKVGSGE
jgi:iron complex transport system ATP-binding protein